MRVYTLIAALVFLFCSLLSGCNDEDTFVMTSADIIGTCWRSEELSTIEGKDGYLAKYYIDFYSTDSCLITEYSPDFLTSKVEWDSFKAEYQLQNKRLTIYYSGYDHSPYAWFGGPIFAWADMESKEQMSLNSRGRKFVLVKTE